MKKLFPLLVFVLLLNTPFSSQANWENLYRIKINEKYGFIDGTGKVIIEPVYETATDFSDGFSLVSEARRKFFINSVGKTVVEPPKNFDVINNFTYGRARGNVTDRERYTKAYIDTSGKIVIDNPRMWGACEFSEGLACVVTDKWGYIDPTGNYVIKPQFNDAFYFSEGLAMFSIMADPAKSRRLYGFVDKSGKIVVPAKYEIANSFSDGLAAVGFALKESYQLGFIDKTGAMVIQPKFEWTNAFSEGLAAVQCGNRWGYIDKAGEFTIKPRFQRANRYSEGLAAVAVDGKWGFIDKTGTFLIPPTYNEAKNFSRGLAMIKVGGLDANASLHDLQYDESGKWGYIDATGKTVWTPSR